MRKNILILAIGFLPNIGGLETHLKDLIDELIKESWKVTVLTYQPLNTPTLGKWIEKEGNLTIFRLPVLRGLFYRLLKIPFMEFLFLEPLLLFVTPLILLRFPDIAVINGQGLIAGFAAGFWAKVFRKRYVVSTQSIYSFPKKGLYRSVCKWIFDSADKVVAISNQSKKDIQSLGISEGKIVVYTNWENKENYQVIDKATAKKEIDFKEKFIVSFFGRLIEEKGINIFLEAIKLSDPKINFIIYGEGPLREDVERFASQYNNTHFMGIVSPKGLSLHYSAADLVVMPSINNEGFGRVASGALFCGTPVIASNNGALPEVVNDAVGRVVNPTPEEIAKSVNFFFTHRQVLKKCADNTRDYALRKFSRVNAKRIISAYL